MAKLDVSWWIFKHQPMCLKQVSASHVGRVFMEPAKPARPWGSCITQIASPAAPVVSKTHFSETSALGALPIRLDAFGMEKLKLNNWKKNISGS